MQFLLEIDLQYTRVHKCIELEMGRLCRCGWRDGVDDGRAGAVPTAGECDHGGARLPAGRAFSRAVLGQQAGATRIGARNVLL